MAEHWWLTLVILATQEAEIRRITFQNCVLQKHIPKKGLVEQLKQ
jgi:hypothetical protein